MKCKPPSRRCQGASALLPLTVLQAELSSADLELLAILQTQAYQGRVRRSELEILPFLPLWTLKKLRRYLARLERAGWLKRSCAGGIELTLYQARPIEGAHPNAEKRRGLLPLSVLRLGLNGRALRVYAALEGLGAAERPRRVSEGYLGALLGLSRSTIVRAKRELREAGLLRGRQKKPKTIVQMRLGHPVAVVVRGGIPVDTESPQFDPQKPSPPLGGYSGAGASACAKTPEEVKGKRQDVYRPGVQYPYLVDKLLVIAPGDARNSAGLVGLEVARILAEGFDPGAIIARVESWARYGRRGPGQLPLQAFLRSVCRRWVVDPARLVESAGGVYWLPELLEGDKAARREELRRLEELEEVGAQLDPAAVPVKSHWMESIVKKSSTIEERGGGPRRLGAVVERAPAVQRALWSWEEETSSEARRSGRNRRLVEASARAEKADAAAKRREAADAAGLALAEVVEAGCRASHAAVQLALHLREELPRADARRLELRRRLELLEEGAPASPPEVLDKRPPAPDLDALREALAKRAPAAEVLEEEPPAEPREVLDKRGDTARRAAHVASQARALELLFSVGLRATPLRVVRVLEVLAECESKEEAIKKVRCEIEKGELA